MSNPGVVSVVLPAPAAADALRQTMQWLDAQTLDYADYQVVFISDGRDDAALARLSQLARHRHVGTMACETGSAPTDTSAVDWSAGLRAATGSFAMLLGPRDRLQHWGLGSLVEVALSGNCDMVLGRSGGEAPIGFAPELLYDTAAAPKDSPNKLLAPCALIRTDLLIESIARAPGSWRAARVHAGLAAQMVAAADSSVGVGPGPAAPESIGDVWREVAQAAALLADSDAGDAAARFVAAHLAATVHRHPSDLDAATAASVVDIVRRHAGTVDPARLAPCQRDAVAAVLADKDADVYGQAVKAFGPWRDLSLTTATESVQWTDGRLAIDVVATVQGTGDELPDGIDAVTPQLMLREVRTTETYPLQSRAESVAVSGDDRRRSRRFRVSGSLDIADAAAGQPLHPGSWQLLVQLRGSGTGEPATSALAYPQASGAVIDGVLVRPYRKDGQLRIEIEGGGQGIFGRYAPDAASIAESADGALLRLTLSDLATRGTAVRPGRLYLGGFALPATLYVDGGGARLESHISGLAGASPLSARIPPGPKQPLGIQLRIGPTGDMAIEPTPSEAPAATTRAAPKKAAKKAPTKSGMKAGKKPTGASQRKQPDSPAVKVARGIGRRVLPRSARRKVRRMLRQLL
jgi:hypothetical protein